MDRLEGGYLGAKPTWDTAASPGVWTLSQMLARRAAGTWPATSALFDPYFESVSLLLHMDGSNASTTFVDSSLSNLAVTANGNAQISTAQSKFGGSSGLFDGTGDWLSGTQTSLIGTGDFTIEAWIYLSSLSNDGEVFCIGDPSNTSAFNIVFEIKSTGSIRGSVQDGSGGVQLDITSSASVIVTSTWQHVAFVVNGSSGVVYVDGTSRASGTVSGSRSQNQTAFRIGRLATSIPRDFNGYIDELRITKGVARYTANFAVPGVGSDEGAALYDPYFDYVSLLLRCNGENNSTTFTDSGNNALAVTANGNTKISTTLSRFGGASAAFDGTGDYLTLSANTALTFGTGDFTIELWLYPLAYGNTVCGASLFGTTNGSTTGWSFNLGESRSRLRLISNLSGTWSDNLSVSTDGGPALNSWSHLALVRKGANITIYVNGTAAATMSSAGSYNFGNGPFFVGRFTDGTNTRELNGYIDDLRVTKGVARYTTNFRPVGPYATSGKLVDPYLTNTSLLLPMTGDNGTTSFFDRSNNFLRATENGNAKVSTTQSKFGAGAAYFDGNNDYLRVASQSNLAFGTGDFTIEFWMYRSGQAVTGNATLIDFRTAEPSTQVMLEAGAAANSNLLQLYVNGAYRITGPAIPTNTWMHIALSRSAGSTRLFVDGYQVGSTYADTNNYSATACVIAGRFAATSGDYRSFNGYLDDLRISTGTARYTAAFTPPERAFNDEAFNDPHYNAVSLLLHMDGTNDSTTFTDSSVNGLTVTANGDAKISTAQSRFGGASAVFDGTGDYLTITPGSFYDFSSSDATIECWLYVTTLSNPFQIIGTNNGASDGKWLGAYVTTNGSVVGVASAGASAGWTAAAGTITTGSWIHVAIVYSGTSAVFYKNGVQVATGAKSASYAFNNTTLYLSRLDGNNSYCLNGYIDEFRITKGIARYTSNFTPPTLPFYNTTIPTADPSFSSVSLLLHMNGTNGSTTFTDSSSNALAVTANGNAQISTAQSKFGGASAAFDGAGDYINASSSTALQFNTSDFTSEMWVRFNSIGDQALHETLPIGGSGTRSAGFVWVLQSTGKLNVYHNNAFLGASATVLTANAWYHIALVRSAGTASYFVNGTKDSATLTLSANLTDTNFICGRLGDSAAYYLNGYIDDLRITKGVARYTSNFYIPRAAFPDA